MGGDDDGCGLAGTRLRATTNVDVGGVEIDLNLFIVVI
jgi:hypothetical protein